MNERRADLELLRAFARAGDQRALADVVRRHLDLVFATALRKVSDVGAAEEISQNVFSALARKAWRFAPDDSLPAWLHKTALLESKCWLRGELRRRRREQTAAELGTTMKPPDDQPAFNALVPLLDEALLSLREKDRTALLLRFHESQSLRDVGAALGVGEDAAQKRVAGALEKLAGFFRRHGFKTATLATTAAALTHTAASASAATAANVTKAASRTTPPTTAGLLALLAVFMSLTRVQKATVYLTVAVTFIAWLRKPKVEQEVSSAKVGQTLVAALYSKDRSPRENALPFDTEQSAGQDSEAAQTQRYIEIMGIIERASYWEGAANSAFSVKPPTTISFVCIMGTNEWWVEHDFVNGGETKWYFDGTNVYNSLRATQPMSEERRELLSRTGMLFLAPTEESKSNLTVNIWESHDGHPFGDAAVNITWLAFCSGNYLKREGRLIPLPDDELHHSPDRFAYTDKTESFDDEFGLPRTVDLFLSKSLFASSIDNFEKEWLSTRRYQDYPQSVVTNLPDGALTFHYVVAESTNFLGWNLPTKFEYFQKGRKYVQNGDWFHRGVGKITSIRLAAKPGNLFVPSRQQTIVDWRFREATSQLNALTYTSTNSFVPPTNDPVLQEKFEKRIARKRGP
jgi:RNA polymerase sigma factor (sigma-70 family)